MRSLMTIGYEMKRLSTFKSDNSKNPQKQNNNNNFGSAWDPFSGQKMSVRGRGQLAKTILHRFVAPWPNTAQQ